MESRPIKVGDRIRRRVGYLKRAVGTVMAVRHTVFGEQAQIYWDQGYGGNRITYQLVRNLERLDS